MSRKINIWKLTASIALPVIGGSILGGIASKSAKEKYTKLEKPSFSPPGWVFPIAWTTLYTTMGVAKYIFDEKPKANQLQRYGDIAYSTQLGLNFLWSFLFFRWKLRGTAFIEAGLLLSAVTMTAHLFYQESKTAGNLMIPYIGWVTFALGLNYSMWQLNKDH